MNEQKKNKLILLLLLATPFLVMLAATIVYKAGYIPEGKKNEGELITPPFSVKDIDFDISDGVTFDYQIVNKEKGNWHIIMFDNDGCRQQRCKELLWQTRQLHVAMGQRARHLTRILVQIQSDDLSVELKKEHPKLSVLKSDIENYQKFKSSIKHPSFDALNKQQLILVDPNGWAMMYYDFSYHNGKQVLKDLKYLLKNKGK
jgi:hypothetical protein